MDGLDFDNMTDEEVEVVLHDIQMGKYNDASTVVSNDAEQASATTDEQGDIDDDTEIDTSESDESGTNDQGDGVDNDTDEADKKDESENNPVDQANESNTDGDTSTDKADDGSIAATEGVDAAEFERYKKFYDQIANAEFNANGKKVKGFTDPEKIIQAQQMAYGFSDKMASFKQYRPFMTSLKERGMLEDPSKFNFIMDLLDGDTEALKQHIKTLNVDPLDLDMETVAYAGKNHISSNEELVLEDTLELAKNYGVEEKLRNTIGKEWDQESFTEFMTVPAVRNDLLEHMSTGAFDLVQDRIKEMKSIDVTGAFSSLKATDQYRQAVQSLTVDAQRQHANQEAATKPAAPRPTVDKDAELAKAQEAEYKRNLEEKNRQAEDARKKAASVSKKKVSTTQNKAFDPLTLEGDELDKFVLSLIRS